MASDRTAGPSRLETALVLIFMVVACLWYAKPQIIYSLYPLYDIWRTFVP